MIRIKPRARLVLCLLAAVWFGAACGKRPPPVRNYTQITTQPQAAGHQHAAPASVPSTRPLQWDTPAEWQEEPGSGMRLASFTAGGPDEPVLATLIALTGDAGGAEANVRRWLTQLGLSLESEDAFQAFLAAQATFQTRGEQTGTLVDFTGLAGDDTAESMLAAVIPVDGRTVFVKMTGPGGRLQAEQDRLRALCESIRTEP